MYKIGENEMVLCPYNRAHVVSKLRIQKHIIKCKAQYPELKLVTCFYNYTHRLKPEDVLKHYEICSHKTRMEEARYCGNNEHYSCSSSSVNDKSMCDSENERGSFFSKHKTNSSKNSVKNEGSQISLLSDVGLKRTTSKMSKVQSEVNKVKTLDCNANDNYEECDLKPLNLPKTVSKAFTSAKQMEKTSNSPGSSQSKFSQSKGCGRGMNFLIPPSSHPRTNDHLLPDVSKMDISFPKKDKPKFFLKSMSVSDVGNSCSASVISSLFDDGNTLKSDDLTFEDVDNDGFIFKNFDKYVKVKDLND